MPLKHLEISSLKENTLITKHPRTKEVTFVHLRFLFRKKILTMFCGRNYLLCSLEDYHGQAHDGWGFSHFSNVFVEHKKSLKGKKINFLLIRFILILNSRVCISDMKLFTMYNGRNYLLCSIKDTITMFSGRNYLLCSVEETIFCFQWKKLFTMFNERNYLLCSVEETIYYVQ